MEDEWQPRPKGQISFIWAGVGVLLALIYLLLIAPRQRGWVRVLVIATALTFLARAWREWRAGQAERKSDS